MHKKILLLTLLFLENYLAIAQPPIDLLNKWGEQAPIQKIHLHTDRDNYLAGESIHFKAYLINDFLPDTSTTTLYVELLDGKKIIANVALPILYSSTMGSITLPDSLATGFYTLRSFSESMVTSAEEFYFYHKIFIAGKTAVLKQQNIQAVDTLQLSFMPEGGNLVQGISSTVAFKINNNKGQWIDAEGQLYNNNNEEIAPISCLHNGMGLFDYTPKIGEQYYVILKNNGTAKKYYLPQALTAGVVVSIFNEPNTCSYEIKQTLTNPSFKAAYMIGQMQHHVAFKKIFDDKATPSIKGIIDTKNLPSGIMQITVFNNEDMPLAERLVFINNREYLINTDVIADTLNTTAGGKNKFFITLKDTIQGQLSVAITDAAFDYSVARERNIVSNLLLTADLSGYIDNPAYYFTSIEDSIKNAVDILMMVHGWRRFTWAEIKTLSANKKSGKAFITLKGEVLIDGYKKPFANKEMMVMINSINARNKKTVQFVQTNTYGEFKLDSLIFFGKNKVFFADIRGKKSDALDVRLSNDTLYAGTLLPQKVWQPIIKPATYTTTTLQLEYAEVQKTKGLLLNAVTVKTTKKSPTQIVDEKYTTGMFGGFANKTIDLVNNNDAQNFINIFDYLQSNVAGLSVVNKDLDYTLYLRQAAAMEGSTPMAVFLDEVETNAAIIANIPPQQIGLIKVYNTFLGGIGNAEGGAIAIYTKKTDDYKNAYQLPNLKVYNGYTVTKEFYAPNYKLSTTGVETDNRLTIDWRPQIFVNNINPKIPISFYNNSRTQSFKVVIEGVTNTGKLIWLEKVISH